MRSAQVLQRDYEDLMILFDATVSDDCEMDQFGKDYRAYAHWAYTEIGEKLLDEMARHRDEPHTEPRSIFELVEEFRAEMLDFLDKTTSERAAVAFSIALDEATYILDMLSDIYETEESECLQFSA